MSYQPYASKEDYTDIYKGNILPDTDIEKHLRHTTGL